jgi:prepilin-type N-terminal cleavage/methylation domain-containing protein
MRPSSHPLLRRLLPAGHTAPTRRGFTLIELLVVVGILVVLLSILLPTVGAARRQGRTAKCLSHLHQIGYGFRAYASDFQGAWPVAVHDDVPTSYLPLGPGVQERRWYDLLVPYVAQNRGLIRNYTDIKRARLDSILWGCPEYTKTLEINPSNPNDASITTAELRPGYGMNYHPLIEAGDAIEVNQAEIRAGQNGRYFRMEQWKPGNRLLVADAAPHVLESPPTLTRTSRWAPYDVPFAVGDFWVEVRHGKPAAGTTAEHKQASYTTPCVGALFVDGSAGLVSVREAWIAHRNPANIPTNKGGVFPAP